VGPVILELPLDKIRRPLMRTRSNDPIKVQELMDSISQIGLQVPVITYSLLQIYVLKIYVWFLGLHIYVLKLSLWYAVDFKDKSF
jgi:sulfiredoxin